MLQVGNIIANKDKYVEGLKKRNLNNAAELLEEVIALDDERKQNQHTLDSNLAEANSLAKQIGGLMKEGKREEAEEGGIFSNSTLAALKGAQAVAPKPKISAPSGPLVAYDSDSD